MAQVFNVSNVKNAVETAVTSRFSDIQSNLDEHIKQFDKLSEMYIEYAFSNNQYIQQVEDNIIKYATALARNIVAVRSMIDILKQTDDSIQEEIDNKFASINDNLDKLLHMITSLQAQTVKRDDYPGSGIHRKYNSLVRIGNIRIPVEKKFSKLSKWIWKKLLGIVILDYRGIKAITIHCTSDQFLERKSTNEHKSN